MLLYAAPLLIRLRVCSSFRYVLYLQLPAINWLVLKHHAVPKRLLAVNMESLPWPNSILIAQSFASPAHKKSGFPPTQLKFSQSKIGGWELSVALLAVSSSSRRPRSSKCFDFALALSPPTGRHPPAMWAGRHPLASLTGDQQTAAAATTTTWA